MQSEDYNLVSLVLPSGILDFFSISKIGSIGKSGGKVKNLYFVQRSATGMVMGTSLFC